MNMLKYMVFYIIISYLKLPMDINELGVSITNKEITEKVEEVKEVINDNNIQPKIEELPKEEIVKDAIDKTFPEKKVSFAEDGLKKRKEDVKEIKPILQNTQETQIQESSLMSFITNNLQTILFAVIMLVICIVFHISNKQTEPVISKPFNPIQQPNQHIQQQHIQQPNRHMNVM